MTTISKSIPEKNIKERAGWAAVKTVLSYGVLFLLALMFIYPFFAGNFNQF